LQVFIIAQQTHTITIIRVFLETRKQHCTSGHVQAHSEGLRTEQEFQIASTIEKFQDFFENRQETTMVKSQATSHELTKSVVYWERFQRLLVPTEVKVKDALGFYSLVFFTNFRLFKDELPILEYWNLLLFFRVYD
jgi:hypothetical protein